MLCLHIVASHLDASHLDAPFTALPGKDLQAGTDGCRQILHMLELVCVFV